MHKNITYSSGSKTVEISFDQVAIDKYLQSFDAPKIKNSGQAKQVFLSATQDFLNQKIDAELLSGIANRIYYVEKFKYSLEFDQDLDQVLDHISELEYNTVTKDVDLVTKHLQELKDYFDKC